jgi:acetyl esterase
MVVLGDSAGATLAAVACNLTQADALPLAAQVLLYPTMGPEILTESVHDYGTGFFLEMEHLHYHYEEYLGEYHDHTDARITPLLADNLEQVPPAVIVVAECDPLRDEAVNYAGLLEHFGVDVELLEAEGMPHSFFKMGGVLPEALEDLDDLGRHVQNFVAAHA